MTSFFNKFKKEDKEKTVQKKTESKVVIETEKGAKKTATSVNKTVTEKKEKKAPIKKSEKKVTGDAYKVLLSPIISEKAAVYESLNIYTFVVGKDASKVEIKNAIKQVYGVEARKVNIINMQGKKMRAGRRFGRRSDWKKAMVTLPKGQTINIHEGV